MTNDFLSSDAELCETSFKQYCEQRWLLQDSFKFFLLAGHFLKHKAEGAPEHTCKGK